MLHVLVLSRTLGRLFKLSSYFGLLREEIGERILKGLNMLPGRLLLHHMARWLLDGSEVCECRALAFTHCISYLLLHFELNALLLLVLFLLDLSVDLDGGPEGHREGKLTD